MFNKEKLTLNDQDKHIVLAFLFGRIWPRSPFMEELIQKPPSTFQPFINKVKVLINA
jgi:hypothetical protein